MMAEPRDIASIVSGEHVGELIASDVEALMTDWPIWVLPVATIPPFELNRDDPSHAQPQFEVEGTVQARYETMSACWAIALYGFPAAVVPCGVSSEGRLESLVRVDTGAAQCPGLGSR